MTVSGGDAEQPPKSAAEPPQGPDEQVASAKNADGDDGKVSKLRIAGYALLVVAVLAALVPILGLAADAPSSSQRASVESSRAASAQTTTEKTPKKTKASKAKAKKKPSSKSRKTSEPAESGPVIDAESNERADAALTRRKLVVGGIAVGLLVIVFWGRRTRSLRRKKIDKQSKGGK